jgi:hypothetical protein
MTVTVFPINRECTRKLVNAGNVSSQ